MLSCAFSGMKIDSMLKKLGLDEKPYIEIQKPVTPAFEISILVYIIHLWLTIMLLAMTAPLPHCTCAHLTCRFVENRRSLHRPVQKLLTASLPTAFKPSAAEAAYPRFPTSPTGSTTMVIFVLSFLKERMITQGLCSGLSPG